MTATCLRGIFTWYQLWLKDIRASADNPVFQYFSLAMQRRIQRKARWNTLAWILLVGLLAVIEGCIIYFSIGRVYTIQDVAIPVTAGAMGLASVVFVLLLVTTLYRVVLDTFSALAAVHKPHKTSKLQLDEMLAVTDLSDREIVVGLLRILLPRLWWLSLGGAVLIWLWWALGSTNFGWDCDPGQALGLLAGGPLAIGGITLSGMLGSVILVCWLLVMGTSAQPRWYAPITGAIVSIGQLLHLPVSFGMLSGFVFMSTEYSDNMMPKFVVGLLLSLAFVALFYRLLLHYCLGRPGRRAWLAVVVPLLLPLGLMLMSVFVPSHFAGRYGPIGALSYLGGWANLYTVNPMGLPSLLLLGIGSDALYRFTGTDMTYNFIAELSWLAALVQQACMVAIGLVAAAAAVNIRRRDMA